MRLFGWEVSRRGEVSRETSADRPEAEGRYLVCPRCASARCHVYKPVVRWWLVEGGLPEPRPYGATNLCLDCGGLWDAGPNGAVATVDLREKKARPEKPPVRDTDLRWRE